MQRDREEGSWLAFVIVLFILAAILIYTSGCLEGPTPPSPPPDNTVHSFLPVTPPTTWLDNTPLDPYRDLSVYRLFALNLMDNQAWFNDNLAIAEVSVFDNNALLEEFNLDLLCVHLPKGEYLLNVKVLSNDGAESPFADNSIYWRNE